MYVGLRKHRRTVGSRGPRAQFTAMDFKDVAPGNALYLRARLEGGLLVLGDVHAARGDGEVLRLAAERAAKVQLQTRDEMLLPERPLILKERSFVAIACRVDCAEAARLAAKDAARILARVCGVTEDEAYLYCSTVGDLRNGAVWPLGKSGTGWVRHVRLVVGLEVPLLGRATPAPRRA